MLYRQLLLCKQVSCRLRDSKVSDSITDNPSEVPAMSTVLRLYCDRKSHVSRAALLLLRAAGIQHEEVAVMCSQLYCTELY